MQIETNQQDLNPSQVDSLQRWCHPWLTSHYPSEGVSDHGRGLATRAPGKSVPRLASCPPTLEICSPGKKQDSWLLRMVEFRARASLSRVEQGAGKKCVRLWSAVLGKRDALLCPSAGAVSCPSGRRCWWGLRIQRRLLRASHTLAISRVLGTFNNGVQKDTQSFLMSATKNAGRPACP